MWEKKHGLHAAHLTVIQRALRVQVMRERGEELRTAVEEWQDKRSVPQPRLTTGFLDGTHPIVDSYELKVRRHSRPACPGLCGSHKHHTQHGLAGSMVRQHIVTWPADHWLPALDSSMAPPSCERAVGAKDTATVGSQVLHPHHQAHKLERLQPQPQACTVGWLGHQPTMWTRAEPPWSQSSRGLPCQAAFLGSAAV